MAKDAELGKAINDMLSMKSLESPLTYDDAFTAESPDGGRKWVIEKAFMTIIDTLGMDKRDESIRGTPKRVAKMFCEEIFYGLDYGNFPECTTFPNKAGYNEMVATRCQVRSVCEHHFVPFIGSAWVAYIPNQKLLGLSKFNRVVDFFSRRPQLQERLVEQVHAALVKILDTQDVAVVVRAKHFCSILRGVEDSTAETITSRMRGKFMEVPSLREEFLLLTRT